MTYATDNNTRQSLHDFQQFDADIQLALLWFGYLDLKEQLHPGAGSSVTVPATALYDEIKALSPEQQLQAQRDIIACHDTPITQTYNALASSAKLELWLLLGEGMERGEIINPPQGYQLPEATNAFTNQIKQLEFEQRINFMRSAVVAMGTVHQPNSRV